MPGWLLATQLFKLPHPYLNKRTDHANAQRSIFF